MGQVLLQLGVIARLLLRVLQAKHGHGNFTQQSLAHLVIRPALVRAYEQRLPIGRILNHLGIRFKKDDPQQSVVIGRLFMGGNPQPAKIWIKWRHAILSSARRAVR